VSRGIYRALLCLHPPAFRRRFADEMLWIYDQAAPDQGAASLVTDGCVSVIRQWLTNSGAWTIAVGAIGGLLELLMAGSLIMGPPQRTYPATPSAARHNDSELERFSGTWKGILGPAKSSASIELTLVKQGAAWIGEVRFQGQDGEMHSGRVEDLRIEGDSLHFRVAAGDADLTFIGRVREGRLAGRLEPTAGAVRAPEDIGKLNPAEPRNPAALFGFQPIAGVKCPQTNRPTVTVNTCSKFVA
jgi:hypothetical protein